EVFPDAADSPDVGLTTQAALGPDLTSHAGYLVPERVELVDHRVDGVLELEDLAADVDGDLLGEVAVRDSGGHVGDVAHLAGEVAGHHVHALGEVLPDTAALLDLRLSAELPLGAHLAGDAGHLPGEAVEL